jgi:hypothetical protein
MQPSRPASPASYSMDRRCRGLARCHFVIDGIDGSPVMHRSVFEAVVGQIGSLVREGGRSSLV